MWFMYVGAALLLLVVCGIYARRRIAGALGQLGVRDQRIRFVRWGMMWLLFGFPALMVLSILGSRVFGTSLMSFFNGPGTTWLLVIPFAWAALVVVQSVPWLLVTDLVHLFVRRRKGAAIAGRVRAIAVLGIVGVFAVYTPARILAERGDVRVRHFEVGAARATTSEPFRIAFIADIQQDAHTDAERARHIYGLVNASHPDVVLSGGDWINTGPDYIASAARAASELTSRLGTFSVRGDHEHFAYGDRQRSVAEVERALQAHGIAMLDNEVRWFEHHGKRIAVAFLNSNYMHRLDHAIVESLVNSMQDADYRIAVTHQLGPALASLLEGKVDLILGGHTHGGQVNPMIGVRHMNLARLETRYVDGRYQLGTTMIIITAGVGYSIVPFRYASPGSIELIELTL